MIMKTNSTGFTNLYIIKSVVLLLLAAGLGCSKEATSVTFTQETSPSISPSPSPAPPVACDFAPTTNMAASVVIGQPNMTQVSANQGGNAPTAQTLSAPDGVSIVNNKLIIGDFSNARNLVFNTIPTTNNASADLVIGQATFTTNSATVDASTTAAGRESVWTGSQLIVADGWNSRLLVFNSFPTSNGQAADFVIGQSDLISNTAGASATKIESLYGGLNFINNKLWLADNNNHRVLTFDLPITANLPAASLVVGQTNFTNRSTVVSASGLNSPAKVITYNGKLIIADRYNHRVLIYNSIPTASTPAADVVIGQTNFTNSTANQGLAGPTASTLNGPHGIAVDDAGRLYIADSLNNRILVFNSIPTANNASADVVIGQPNFTSNAANAGGAASAQTLKKTTDLTFFQCSLIVEDQSNHRVLIYK